MSKSLQKPTILNVETVARSRLFTVESVDLEFSNGVRRVYERMRPTNREAVMIVPIVDDHLILIREYAVGSLLISILNPVRRAARRAFCPSLPIASDNW